MFYILLQKITNSRYNCGFKKLRDQFSPFLINTTYENVHNLNQLKGKITGYKTIDPKIVNNNGFCYQCSKDGPDFLFGKLVSRDKIYEKVPLEKQIKFLMNII